MLEKSSFHWNGPLLWLSGRTHIWEYINFIVLGWQNSFLAYWFSAFLAWTVIVSAYDCVGQGKPFHRGLGSPGLCLGWSDTWGRCLVPTSPPEAQLCAHRTEQRAGDWVSDMVLGEHEAQIWHSPILGSDPRIQEAWDIPGLPRKAPWSKVLVVTLAYAEWPWYPTIERHLA